MARIDQLMAAINERHIAGTVIRPHDDAFIHYRFRSNTVASPAEHKAILGDYYAYHFCACVAHGGRMSPVDAAAFGCAIVEREYRRRGGDIVQAYEDAHEGLAGGIFEQVRMIAEALKTEAVERYIQHVFDEYVAPNSWQEKVEIIRQFIERFGSYLSLSDHENIERYAKDYKELIRSFVDGLRRTSAVSRRL